MQEPSRRDLLAGAAALTAAAFVPRVGGAAAVDDQFYWNTLDEPLDLGATATAIPTAPPPTALPAAPVEPENATAQYGNLRHDARMGGALPVGSWQVRWHTSVWLLNQHGAVLHTGDRVLVHDWRHWKLFDTSGGMVNGGSMADGEVSIDPDHGMFLLWNTTGAAEARRLTDGQRAFDLQLSEPKRMSKVTFLARVGRRVVAAGVEQPAQAALGPNLSCIHVHDLGDPIRVDTQYRVQPPNPPLRLIRKHPDLQVALSGDRLFLAAPRWFYRTDLALYVEAAWTADFEPVAMSVDEAGRIHAVVRTADQLALWVLSPQGERVVGLDLPEVRFVLGPPAIGYDHRVYVLAPGRVIAVEPGGTFAWDVAVEGGNAGWGVTADHRLLLSNGPKLLSVGPRGRPTVVHEFDAPLATAPVLTRGGRILVATAKTLYCLSPSA